MFVASSLPSLEVGVCQQKNFLNIEPNFKAFFMLDLQMYHLLYFKSTLKLRHIIHYFMLFQTQEVRATEALTVLVQGLRKPKKIACGYFLVKGTGAPLMTKIIDSGLRKTAQAGVKIHVTVADGHSSNIAAFQVNII